MLVHMEVSVSSWRGTSSHHPLFSGIFPLGKASSESSCWGFPIYGNTHMLFICWFAFYISPCSTRMLGHIFNITARITARITAPNIINSIKSSVFHQVNSESILDLWSIWDASFRWQQIDPWHPVGSMPRFGADSAETETQGAWSVGPELKLETDSWWL